MNILSCSGAPMATYEWNQSSVGCLLVKEGDAITVSWIHKGGSEQDVKTLK